MKHVVYYFFFRKNNNNNIISIWCEIIEVYSHDAGASEVVNSSNNEADQHLLSQAIKVVEVQPREFTVATN